MLIILTSIQWNDWLDDVVKSVIVIELINI